ALDHYQRNERPFIYTFFKTMDAKQSSADPEELASLRAFQVKLSQLGHYWSSYKSIEDLQLQFYRQLDTLLFY
ncbi:MAG TPA: hypothetical protein VJR89_32330, partial [Polyangiales bacterium]|nr:hypothetical protein [Polyangiales bacterium]